MLSKAVELKRDHLRMVEILGEAGIPKNTARVLTFIAVAGRTHSAQIQGGTGMRQPEVSIALKELYERRWILRQSVQREGKGRPIYVYRLKRDVLEIVEAVEKEQERRVRQILKDKEDLRAIAEKLDMKPDGVKSLLRRTRELLRECVERKIKSADWRNENQP